MASSLMERMKKSRGQSAATIQSAVAASSGGFTKDDRIWKYTYLDSGKKDLKTKKSIMYSSSVIRFLPIPFIDIRKQDEGKISAEAVLSPVVLVCRHDFKSSNGSRYSELALKTLGQECPVNEHDRPLWEAWKDAGKPDNNDKKVLVGRIAKDEYYANILVVDDKAAPDNNGKVFLFKFSAAIKKMIDQAFDPSIPTNPTFDPFDPFDGAELHLTFMGEERSFNGWNGLVPADMSKESSWVNNPMCGGDEAKIEETMELAYSLQDFIDPALFKSYAVLKERLLAVLGLESGEESVVPDTKQVSNSTGAAPANTGDDQAVEEKVDDKQSSPVSTTEGAGDDMDEFERMLLNS